MASNIDKTIFRFFLFFTFVIAVGCTMRYFFEPMWAFGLTVLTLGVVESVIRAILRFLQPLQKPLAKHHQRDDEALVGAAILTAPNTGAYFAAQRAARVYRPIPPPPPPTAAAPRPSSDDDDLLTTTVVVAATSAVISALDTPDTPPVSSDAGNDDSITGQGGDFGGAGASGDW